MAGTLFDTLKYANTLKAAGVPDKQAEAQVSFFADVIQLNLKELVTKDDLALTAEASKDDLAATAKELKQEIAATAKELKQEIAEVRKDLKQEIAEVRKDLKQEIAEVRKDLKQEITNVRDELKQEIKDAEQRSNIKIDNGLNEVKLQIATIKGELVLIRWMLGVMVGGIATILIRMFFFQGIH